MDWMEAANYIRENQGRICQNCGQKIAPGEICQKCQKSEFFLADEIKFSKKELEVY